MTKIKIEKVVSFSSEDPVYVAANLLTGKKWKCRTPGEKSASVVLQLEKASTISSIDIGNEHSAYIEVLANRSGGDDDFKMLLVMSSFMSPLDSRQSQNVNQVRMFSFDQLAQPERDQKWDRIKVVCTQPFNKSVQYGLSFITLHQNEDRSDNGTAASTQLGKFSLRAESPDNLSVGSLFARRKEANNGTPLKGAAAIREASLNPTTPRTKSPLIKKTPSTATPSSDNVDSPRNRNRDEILYSDEPKDTNEKINKLVENKRKEDEEKKAKLEAEREKKRKLDEERKAEREAERKRKEEVQKAKEREAARKLKEAEKKKNAAGPSDADKKRKGDPPPEKPKRPKITKVTRPFHELLRGVVLVISGIQNPERALLRTDAIAMGAKYKPDWDSTCTHLICAFPNTPKFNQVKGKGKIVTKRWITECSSQRKRLPWRRFALDPNDLKRDESEDEVCETRIGDEFRETTINSGSDTEDEIERIQAKMQMENNQNDDRLSPDQADEVVQNGQGVRSDAPSRSLPKLPDFFGDKKFYIHCLLDDSVKSLLTKYIVAYGGEASEDMDLSDADVLIMTEEHLEDLPGCSNNAATIVTPDWIWHCHNNKSLMPQHDFTIAN